MATGPLRFRTPHIEEIPTTNTKQAPGFAWVTVAKDADPAKAALEVTSKKRARTAGLGQNEAQREALSVRQQRDIERRVRELNTDGSRDVYVPVPKKEGSGSSAVKAGKTTNTKRILASGKEFKHYLDDEEAELARTGKVDGLERDAEVQIMPAQRASKTPIARRLQQERSSMSGSPAPATDPSQTASSLPFEPGRLPGDEEDGVAPLPTEEEMQALLDAPPLTYNAARVAAPPASAAPPRTFCEICGFWGRVKCLRCGARTCSVDCESVHVADRCLKFYA